MRASDRAYDTLRQEILDGVLTPGTLLGEVDQAERLGLSRTPLREALSRLIADGLADQTKGRGTLVSSISAADVDLLFELRLPLEVQSARLAAERGDPRRFSALAERFSAAEKILRSRERQRDHTQDHAEEDEHYYALTEELDEAVSDAVANPYLSHSLRSMRAHLVRARRLAQHEPERLAASAREHREVCTAIASGDAETAGAAMLIHLRRSLAYITAQHETAQSAQQHRSLTPNREEPPA
ncbi:GntR family transcriptional regulator [Nesterenkonia sp. LB17]|uniref:GntR family transcriptional regulator n=1 Tax=unclassified Nesterenkonia TaxID=2629769 RepID=UPI001F4D0AED|nr:MULTISPECIES: GntR family transcriptional regulator [unclassified Nesterenkonia]MCH8561086.1 GntR family transcriptional regulator [Nesterenkonia sp. DZ6]MCH8562611.1 GntR family transcriptional regulator [Nesterenkonia sp. YGD6]MCH8565534.1 GntR family transcriptional regulator [Nesterenkonia sp. LB17]MCH8572109.1 GntR family transcriptional regulator [Nesterenkonia sp. AY15]